MQKNKRSPIWKIETTELKKLVDKSQSYAELLSWFGLRYIGGNYKTLRERLIADGIDTIEFGKKSFANRKKKGSKLTHEQIFCKDSKVNRSTVRKAILSKGLLAHECSECKCSPEWNNKKLVLILDHINGINNDNRIENLRWLCPNCNSQTDTFCGRNIKTVSEFSKVCKCGSPKWYLAKCCNVCERERRVRTKYGRKVEWPSKQTLQGMIATMTWTEIGKRYGVSDNAVRNWAKKYSLLERK